MDGDNDRDNVGDSCPEDIDGDVLEAPGDNVGDSDPVAAGDGALGAHRPQPRRSSIALTLADDATIATTIKNPKGLMATSLRGKHQHISGTPEKSDKTPTSQPLLIIVQCAREFK